MHIDAFLCDAVTSREGLLHVLGGGIAALTRSQFPAPLGISIAAVLSTEVRGTYNVSVTIKREGYAEPVGAVHGPIEAAPAAGDDDGVVLPFPVGLGGIQLPAPGKYLIEISVDGKLLRTLWFRANLPRGQAVR